MKVQELRIGNWITYPKYWGDEPIRITGVNIVDRRDDESGIYEEFLSLLGNDFLTSDNFDSFVDYKNGVINPEELKPIPLTEEWLLKFGFEKNITTDLYPTFSYDILNVNDGIVYVLNYGFVNHIKYIHQLQNLYFALTGEELQSKD
jgi:hypothetical protein